MKKRSAFSVLALFVCGSAIASTDHYFLRDGTHVHHLKITRVGEDITVTADVNFEPNAAEGGREACSAQISGEAKSVSDNVLLLKKQIEGEARYCSLTIQLTPDGAKLEQSPECGYFAAGICHFDSDGKELVRIK